MQFSAPQITRDTDQMRRILRGWRGAGATVALVPIMAGLHDGHFSLIETAKRHASRVVISVSGDVDMAQAILLDRASVDMIFAPQTMTGKTQVRVSDAGLGDPDALGAFVTSIARLLGQIHPEVVILGEKDWRQLVAVREVVRDLAIPVGVVSSATVREDDGLSISTRNRLLTQEQRVTAPMLHKVLTACANLIAQGSPVEQVVTATHKFLSESGFDSIEYVAARRAHDLAEMSVFDPAKPARLLAAVQLGRVRLTDNVPIRRTQS
jgi:pantoate--beta-alanine ligase